MLAYLTLTKTRRQAEGRHARDAVEVGRKPAGVGLSGPADTRAERAAHPVAARPLAAECPEFP
jgi:hypothetical protein